VDQRSVSSNRIAYDDRKEYQTHGTAMKSRVSWRICCIYAAFGEAWIILSSILVWLEVGEQPTLASFLEMGKGSVFILVTSVLLFTMLRRWEEEINRRAEEMCQSEARYRLLHESLRDGFGQATMDGRFLYCNAVYCNMLGYSEAELLKLTYLDLTPPRWHDLESDIIAKQVLVRGYSDVYEKEYRHKNGSLIPVELRTILVRDEAGKPSSMYAIVRDTTERRAQEARDAALKEQLIHVGRVQELGQVSAGIAHELNQPLAAMQNYASAARRLIERGDSAAASQTIAKAGEQAMRAGDIVQRMRTFVEKRDTHKTREDINAIVREAAALGLIGAKALGIETRYCLATDLPPVIADRVQIEQVLVNLLHNAMDAMAKGPERILTLSSWQNTDVVEIIISDTGHGIPEPVSNSLFQPFVTTKPNGMGIGLAISKSIIEAHGGTIFAEANPGGGTRFCVHLPPAPPLGEG
jgi:two-component system sensor kinase FixL